MRLTLLLVMVLSWPAVGLAQQTEPEVAQEPELAQEQEPAQEPEVVQEPAQEPEVVQEPAPDPTPEPEEHTNRPPRDGGEPGSAATGALGILTFAGLALTVASVAVVLERANSVDACEAFEAEEAPTRGCLNLGSIRDERDVSLGIMIGSGIFTVGTGLAWLIVALVEGGRAEPEAETLRCTPGPGTLECALRF